MDTTNISTGDLAGRDPILWSIYGGKHACVLGGAGFVGSALVRKLLLHHSSVVVIDNFSRGSTKVRGASYIDIDITRTRQYLDVPGMLPYKLDYIFNLAAFVAGVDYNMSNQQLMYEKNMELLIAPLDWAATTGARYLQTSSVCVYPENMQVDSREEQAFLGKPHPANEGYSEAKRQGEIAAAESDIPHVVIVRPSNVIGPRDYYDDRAHVLPHLVKRAFAVRESGGPFEVWGNPEVTREFVHSDDVAAGMMFALGRGQNREAYNIGTGGDTEVSIRALALMVMDAVPAPAELVFNQDRGGGDERRSSNADRLRSLGWRHKKSVGDGVVDAVETFAYHSAWT